MRKKIFAILISFSIVFSCSSKEGNTAIEKPKSTFYSVAYLPTWKMPYTPDWDKITHLCLAFGLVQADGNLDVAEVTKYKDLVKTGHDNNVKVLLSIGGGGTKNFSSAILNETNRNRLIDNLAKVVKDLNLDGIDVDYEEWEGGDNGASSLDLEKRSALETTYRLLRERLGDKKLISAAVNASWDNNGWGSYNCFNNTMHEYLDFVSLMIYDETGPWSGTKTGAHSSWDFFQKAIDHWLNNRKLPKEKLVAGVPFYGYEFKSENNAADAEGIGYRDILIKYPNADAHLVDNIGLLYYDGMPTIKRKAEYIKNNKLGGIMFWEISQDTDNADKSLLKIIDDVLLKP